MSIDDRTRQNYDAARQEILHRMQLRDQALLTYLTLTGVILSVAFGTQANQEILLAIPFISFGITILVSQHYVMMAVLSQFCTNELEPFVNDKLHEGVPQWDNSKIFHDYVERSSGLRVLGHSIIILVPSILALLANLNHRNTVWFVAFFCLLGIICAIVYAQYIRLKLYGERDWRRN